MNKAGLFFFGAVVSIGSLMFAGTGCSSGSAGTGGSGGSSSSTTTSTSSKSSSTTTSTSTSSSSGGATLDCKSYCGEIMANCTGANAQYKDEATCEAVCAGFPTPGKLGDTSGDTLGCRIYHGGDPAKSAPATHCEHAGPTGGDQDVTDAMAGTCGEGCEAFCAIQAKVCTGANAPYKDIPTCMTDCKTFKKDTAAYTITDVDTNDFGCRVYHLSAATADPATHCKHIVAASATCTK